MIGNGNNGPVISNSREPASWRFYLLRPKHRRVQLFLRLLRGLLQGHCEFFGQQLLGLSLILLVCGGQPLSPFLLGLLLQAELLQQPQPPVQALCGKQLVVIRDQLLAFFDTGRADLQLVQAVQVSICFLPGDDGPEILLLLGGDLAVLVAGGKGRAEGVIFLVAVLQKAQLSDGLDPADAVVSIHHILADVILHAVGALLSLYFFLFCDYFITKSFFFQRRYCTKSAQRKACKMPRALCFFPLRQQSHRSPLRVPGRVRDVVADHEAAQGREIVIV